jgi:antitoxin VapB
MASLYIKDSETADLVTQTARRTGKTKTAVVREAVAAFAQQLPAPAKPKSVEDVKRQLADWRAAHPLAPNPDRKPDKTFFDTMWGDG